jgi:hypothetical protein
MKVKKYPIRLAEWLEAEHLPSKHKALSPTPSTTKKRKKERSNHLECAYPHHPETKIAFLQDKKNMP